MATAITATAPRSVERQLYYLLQQGRKDYYGKIREDAMRMIRVVVIFGEDQVLVPVPRAESLEYLYKEIEKRLLAHYNKTVTIKRVTYTEDGIAVKPDKRDPSVGRVIKSGVTVWAYETEASSNPELDIAVEELEREFPEPDSFTVTRLVVRDPITKEVIENKVVLKIIAEDLKRALRSILSKSALYSKKPVDISARELMKYLPVIKTKNRSRKTHMQLKLDRLKQRKIYEMTKHEKPKQSTGKIRSMDEVWAPLCEFLTKEFAAVTKKIEAMLKDKKITYDSLWYVFNPKQMIKVRVGLAWVGMKVKKADYVRSSWSPRFDVVGTCIKTNGAQFYTTDQTYTLPPFKGVMKLEELPFMPLDDDTKKELTERGKLFRDLGFGAHYRKYTGSISKKQWWATNLIRADGRVMVDCYTFLRMNPNYSVFSRRPTSIVHNLTDENLWMTWPTIGGFSFSAKTWGEISVTDLGPVDWDTTAFERLVFPDKNKSLIESLVKNQRRTDLPVDFIQGKGAGCIFLLHGSPGTGKTLTAEAIAELLKRPLYSVSVGELGTDTANLETKLKEILDLAESWDAVILIDEADIFLEARQDNDVTRNAMVGVFLRLLEYHDGVLFLTTNRVKCFDSAFHSRISIALKYHDFGDDTRKKVWDNLLKSAGITTLDSNALLKYDLNGRQIRSTIRLSQSIAKTEGVPISEEHIERTVGITVAFKNAFK